MLSGVKGLLVRGQKSEKATDTQPEKYSHACVLVPAPNFQKIIIIKTISDVSKQNSVELVINSLKDQFRALEEQYSLTKEDMVLVFWAEKNLKDCKQALEPACKKALKQSCFPKLWDFIKDRNQLAPIIYDTASQNRNSAGISQFVRSQKKVTKQTLYQITSKKFLCGGNDKCSFNNKDETHRVYEIYFSECRDKLVFVPDIDKICDSLLYKTTDDGELPKLCERASYYGEVTLFIQKYLSQLESPNGIMLKNYSSKHFETVLDENSDLPGKFETDWLYLGKDKITAIEIGLSESRENNKTAIQNKIRQVLTKTVPHFQLVIYSLCMLFDEKLGESKFRTILGHSFSMLIIFPNISKKKFEEFFADERTNETKDLIKLNENVLGCIKFVFESDLQQNSSNQQNLTNELTSSLFKLSKNLTLEKLITPFSTIFTCDKSADGEFLADINTVLALSSLNFLNFVSKEKCDTTDRDDRYRQSQSFALWRKKKETLTYNEMDFILSPEQHAILANNSDKMKRVVFIGEPGCGKTSLLLAKCHILAERKEVDQIFYVVPDDREMFIEKLEEIIQQCGSEAVRRILRVKRINIVSGLRACNAFEESLRSVLLSYYIFFIETGLSG